MRTLAQYSFDVIGPQSSVPVLVPVEFNVVMSSAVSDPHGSMTNGEFSVAETVFGTANGGDASDRMTCAGNCYSSLVAASTMDADVTVFETVGVPDTITIQAITDSEFGDGGMPYGVATVDPYIFIDPSFANASKYSIQVGAGVGNSPDLVPAVPAPSAYASMLAGLGFIAFMSRRRRDESRN